MKKICFITTIHTTMQDFIIPLTEYIHQKTDWEIHLICNSDSLFEKSLPGYICYHPVAMKRGMNLDGIRVICQLVGIFRQERFDLVQYSTPNASLYASIASAIAKVPVRLYCQWGMAYVGFQGLKRKIFKVIEKTVCTLSTWVEPDSFGNLEFSHTEGLYPAHKGSVIWNGSASGVDLEKFDVSQKQIWRKAKRAEFQIPTDAVVYGFVGRITGDKGINELFTSFRAILEQAPNAYLMMVGNSEKSDSVNTELYHWAQQEPRVLFCGYTDMVAQYLSAMDIYVLPSYREGFGSTVIEAEAMGLPVIVTNIPGPTNAMVRDGTGLVIPKKDAAALQHAMEKLLREPKLCQKFGEAGCRLVLERFEQQKLFYHVLEDRKRLLGDEG